LSAPIGYRAEKEFPRAVPQFLLTRISRIPGIKTVEMTAIPIAPAIGHQADAERAARAFRAAYARCILTWLPQSAIEHHRRTWLREAS
jgi:hypothetical protein